MGDLDRILSAVKTKPIYSSRSFNWRGVRECGILGLMEWMTDHAEAIGMMAAMLTTGAFAPQVVRTWRLGGQGLSWMMLASFGTGVGLWFVYGYLRASTPIMVANGLTGLQVIFIAGLKLWRTT